MKTLTKPTEPFAKSVRAEPENLTATNDTFRARLSYQGKTIGYLGKDKNGWAMIVSAESEATKLEKYTWPYNSQDFYKDAQGNWLSVKAGTDAVGFYDTWQAASSWTIAGNTFINGYSGGKLSRYSMDYEYLYARNDYQTLQVELTLVS